MIINSLHPLKAVISFKGGLFLTGLHNPCVSSAQVSMLIGVILSLTQRLPARLRMALGTGVLLLYVGLTGLEAAVLRAGIMGVIALFALTAERKVRPLGAIVFAAVLLLLWQPLWIFDLGFQLSFLATLGLLVTVPVLNRWLDWLPTAIAPLISVPIAAYVWVFPIQLYAFGIVSPYSILINVLTAPLIMIISIGGMISALAALFHPMLGSLSAGALYYPTTLFIKLAEWGNHLPGNRFAVGAIALSQVLILYGLLIVIWWRPRWQRYWWVAGLVGISLVVLPASYTATHLYRATVLATATDPVLVVQDKGNVGLINSGTETDAQLTLLPFFQKQGINRLQWAIATHVNESNQASWQRLREQITIQTLYSNPPLPTAAASETVSSPQPPNHPAPTSAPLLPLATDQPVQLGAATVNVISTDPAALQVQLADQTWLLLNPLPAIEQQAPAIAQLQHSVQVLWWSGEALHPKLLAALNPKVAIASAKSISPATEQWLKAHAATIYCTGRDGAIQWTPEQGFKTILESDTN